MQAMVRYGEDVGVAFQLADDVLDLASDTDESGKRPGTDLREGVPTLPVLLARRAAAEGDADARAVVDLLDSGRLADDDVLAEAVAALRATPSPRPPAPPRASGRTAPPPTSPPCRRRPRARRSRCTPPRRGPRGLTPPPAVASSSPDPGGAPPGDTPWGDVWVSR